MIKCIECGKVIKDGGPRYATPDGSYCCECWANKDQKFKDDMLKRALYGAAVRGARFLNAINEKGGKR
ncbi:hypothetical protein BT47P1_00049 [Bacteroides phage BT47P1]|nr:hypothetical protein BT47P1_00049 [Bacteroides phage BT47P1]